MKSLSKEDIYEKHTGTNMELQYIPTPKENVLEMMDEYAKQQSIEFTEWLFRSDYKRTASRPDVSFYKNDKSYGIEQLYELFEQHKSNQP